MSNLSLFGLGKSSSGAGGFTPPSGIQLWLNDTSGFIKNGGGSPSDGDPITQWTDASSAGNNFSQSTLGNMPVYKTNIKGTLPGVLFDNTDDYLINTSPTNLLGQSFTVFFAAKQIASLGAPHCVFVFGSTAVANGKYFEYTPAPRQRVTQENVLQVGVSTTIVSDNNFHVCAFRFNSGTGAYNFYLDGSADGSGTSAAVFSTQSSAWIGGDQGPTSSFNGYFGEFMYFNTNLADADVTSVNSYLTGRWI